MQPTAAILTGSLAAILASPYITQPTYKTPKKHLKKPLPSRHQSEPQIGIPMQRTGKSGGKTRVFGGRGEGGDKPRPYCTI